MCFHVSAKKEQEALQKRFGAKVAAGTTIVPEKHLNGFAHPKLPVITSENPTSIDLYQWGLIPFFAKDLADAKTRMKQTLNARSETVFELPSFKNSILKNRCLVLVDGFYEWKEEGKKKIKHYITLKNQEPFAFGGIYTHWVDKSTGEIFKTFSILTTPANTLMSEIHTTKKRMPLILPPHLEQEWMNPNLSSSDIKALLNPLEDGILEAVIEN